MSLISHAHLLLEFVVGAGTELLLPMLAVSTVQKRGPMALREDPKTENKLNT